MKRRDLDWSQVALAGDVGAVPQLRPTVAMTVNRRRPKPLTIILLLVWLAWEGSGVLRAATIGPPILRAMWGMS